jgi:hypothetical protein
MRVDSIQSVNHITPNQRVLERVFYGTDERTGVKVQQSYYYVIEVYNEKGKVEESQKGKNIDLRV